MNMRVAIIGAGCTGSILAELLHQQDVDVHVFEKSRGSGGRVSSKREQWGQFDLGAPFIPANDPEFIRFMDKQIESGIAHCWPDKVDQYTSKLIPDQRDACFYVFAKGMNEGCKQWLQHVEFTTQVKITKLIKGKHDWQLLDEQGKLYEGFDKIVVTAPWPQTHALISEHAVISVPLKQQRWSSCWTLALQFSSPLNLSTSVVYPQTGYLQTIVNDSTKPGRQQDNNIWVGYFTNDFSDLYQDKPASELVGHMQEELERISGGPIPETVNYYAHLWRYARMSRGQSPLGVITYGNNGVIAGGDWSHGASVQNAFITARQLFSTVVS